MTTIRSDIASLSGLSALDALSRAGAPELGRGPQSFADFSAFDASAARIEVPAQGAGAVDISHTARTIASRLIDA